MEESGIEALVIVVEVDGEPDEAQIAAAIRTAVLREFEVHVADVLLVGPQGIPKTSSGKKQRAMTRRLAGRSERHGGGRAGDQLIGYNLVECSLRRAVSTSSSHCDGVQRLTSGRDDSSSSKGTRTSHCSSSRDRDSSSRPRISSAK